MLEIFSAHKMQTGTPLTVNDTFQVVGFSHLKPKANNNINEKLIL